MSEVQIAGSSIWEATALVPAHPALGSNTRADVCVVGAGIAGLTTAYLLGRAGRRVVVLDNRRIGAGQTQLTTAHLSNQLDAYYSNVEKLYGLDESRMAAQSHTAAIDLIEAIVREERIECEFERVDAYLFAPQGESSERIDQEYEAAARTGVLDVQRVASAPLQHYETGPAIRFSRNGQFHPLKYLLGLASAIERDGGRIFGDTRVMQVDGGDTARIETAAGATVEADAVVVASNAPVNDRVTIHSKQAPYRTYAIGARVPKDTVVRALYYDTLDPYHYVRLQTVPSDAGPVDWLIVGGEDHKTGQASDMAERFERLERWARQRFPTMEPVEFRWTGQVMETIDGLAFIGRNPGDKENVFIATGDNGMGMTHGTIAGMLLSDLILGKQNPWEKLYDPSRKPVKTIGKYVEENLNVAGQYTAWATGGEVDSVDEIPPGHGAILRRGLTKMAVYRTDQGELIERSAVCTHLGCIVAWNAATRTWDCPCHGSQFNTRGEVVNGPAIKDLAEAESAPSAKE